MTDKEAFEILSVFDFEKISISGKAKDVAEYTGAISIAVDALEKQIPKRPFEQDFINPIYGNDGCQADAIFLYKAMCPNCGGVLAYGELELSDCVDIKFCDNCGQAIDWSE